MGLASKPAEIDTGDALRRARVLYDDAAWERISSHAAKIRRELEKMQDVGRARRCRSMAIANICQVLNTNEFGEGLAALLPESLR